MFTSPTKHLMTMDIDVHILVSQLWKNAPFNNQRPSCVLKGHLYALGIYYFRDVT